MAHQIIILLMSNQELAAHLSVYRGKIVCRRDTMTGTTRRVKQHAWTSQRVLSSAGCGVFTFLLGCDVASSMFCVGWRESASLSLTRASVVRCCATNVTSAAKSRNQSSGIYLITGPVCEIFCYFLYICCFFFGGVLLSHVRIAT